MNKPLVPGSSITCRSEPNSFSDFSPTWALIFQGQKRILCVNNVQAEKQRKEEQVKHFPCKISHFGHKGIYGHGGKRLGRRYR